MDKTRFSELKQSLIEASEIARGVRSPARIWVTPDLKKFREDQGLSQRAFSTLLGISENTLQNWELGRRKPSRSAQVLIEILAEHPELIGERVVSTKPKVRKVNK